MTNSLTASEAQGPAPTGPLKCGDVATYRQQKKQKTNKQNRDHVPATSSVLAAAEKRPGYYDGLTGPQKSCIETGLQMDALTVAIPKGVHKKGRTYAGRGGQARVDKDVKNLRQAAKDDFAEIEPMLSEECAKKYKEAQKKILAQFNDKLFDDVKAKCTGG